MSSQRIKSGSPVPDDAPMDLQGKQGAGAFQWNAGGWFGSQLGLTLWLVLLGGVLLAGSQPVGGRVVALGLLANVVGTLLWMRRHTLSPYPAIQALIAVGGLTALLALVAISLSDVSRASAGLPSPWFLLMYPGLMLAFHCREREARRIAAE